MHEVIVRAVPRGEERSKMLERSFRNRCAGVYDLATRLGNKKLAEAVTWIMGSPRPCDHPLDAACGTGTFACLLTPAVELVLACNCSEKMFGQARRKAARRGLYNTVFRVRGLRSLMLLRGVFDAAICADILHFLDSSENTTTQLKMVVRLGSPIIVTNYVHETRASSARVELVSRLGLEFVQDWGVAVLEEFLSEQDLRITDKRPFNVWQPLEVVVRRADDDVV